jgi:hypothetical protein
MTEETYYITIEDPDGPFVVYAPPDEPPTAVISVKGEKGDTGATGDTGPAGGGGGGDGSLWYTGAGEPGVGLGADDDMFLQEGDAGAGLDGDVWQKAAGAWALTGTNIKGAQGSAGANGNDGAQGAIGPTGPTGADGADGADGSNGAPGANGSDGADGKTILNGTTDPTTEGVDGDFYLNTATSTLFGPKATTWPAGVPLVGPQGSQGDPGADGADGAVGPTGPTGAAGADGSDGAQGPAGNDGADGAAGADGKTVLNGAVDPTTEGVDGDFFINTTSNTLFGPKAAGSWPSGVSLVGPAGANGSDGADGAQGPAGPAGATGATGAAGADGADGVAAPLSLIHAQSDQDTVDVGTSWATLTFGAATIVGTDFSHTTGTDSFTVVGAGYRYVGFQIVGQGATNRVQLEGRITVNGTAVTGFATSNYSARNSTQPKGGINFVRPLLLADGDVVRVEALKVGDVANIIADDTFFFMTDVTGPKGDTGAAGPPGDIEAYTAATFSATINLDFTTVSHYSVAVTGDCTINATNLNEGQSGALRLNFDGSTHTVTLGTGWTGEDQTKPVIPTTASQNHLIPFHSPDGVVAIASAITNY